MAVRKRFRIDVLERRTLLSVPAFGDPVFTALPSSPAFHPTPDGFSDLDSDGYADIIVSYQKTSNPNEGFIVAVMKGNEDGTFTTAPAADMPGRLRAVKFSDFNGDGRRDILLHSQTYNLSTPDFDRFDVMLGNADGSFTHAGSQISALANSELEVFDMNGDGKSDLAIKENPFLDLPNINVMRGVGNGAFLANVRTEFELGTRICSYRDDLTGDGIADILTNWPGLDENPLELHPGRTDGTFAATPTWSTGGDLTIFHSLLEMNGDSLPDIIATRAAPENPYSVSIAVFGNKGNGTFTSKTNLPLGGGLDWPFSADVNDDGSMDLLAFVHPDADPDSDQVIVLKNDGTGVLTASQTVNVTESDFMIPLDMNADDCPDLVCSSFMVSGTEWGTRIFFYNTVSGTYGTTPLLLKPIVQPDPPYGMPFSADESSLLDVFFNVVSRDGDGKVLSNLLLVYENNGDMTFQAPQSTEFGANTLFNSLLFDANGDGIAETLPFRDYQPDETAGGFSTWTWNGTGQFSATGNIAETDGRIALQMNIYDHDTDGLSDILLVGTSPIGVYSVRNASANAAPEATIESPDDGLVIAPGDSVNLQGSATDADGAITEWHWTVTDPDGIEWTSDLEDPGLLVLDKLGIYEISLNVTDNEGLADPTPPSASVIVETYVNKPPDGTIDSPTVGTAIFPGQSINLRGSGTDTDGTIAGWNWQIAGPSGFSWSSSVEDPGLLELNALGGYTITMTVTDDDGLADPTPATVSVIVYGEINQPPNGIIDSPAEGTTILQGQKINLMGSGADADGGIASWSWLVTGPAGFSWASSFEDPGLLQLNTPGSYVVSLVVTDNDGAPDPIPAISRVTVIEAGNLPPNGVITSPADGAVVNAGDFVNLTANGSDSDGTIAGWLWLITGPQSLSFVVEDPGPVRLDAPGDYAITLTVTDDDGEADPVPDVVEIRVNAAPAADNLAAATAEDSPVSIILNAIDPNGDAITYSISAQPSHGSVAFAPGGDGTEVIFTPAKDFAGTDTFSYIASDPYSAGLPAVVTVTVNPVNDPPVAFDVAGDAREDSPVDIPLVAQDVDNPPGELTWIITDLPLHGTVSLVGGIATYTPDTGYLGVDTFGFRVSDAEPLSDDGLVTITVRPGWDLLGVVDTGGGKVYVYDMDGIGYGAPIDGDYDATDGAPYRIANPANDLLITRNGAGVVIVARSWTYDGTWRQADFTNLGIVVEGPLAAFLDQRLLDGNISFIASTGKMGTVLVNSPVTGMSDGDLEVAGVLTVPEGAGVYCAGESVSLLWANAAGDGMEADVVARKIGSFLISHGMTGRALVEGAIDLVFAGYRGPSDFTGSISAGSIGLFYNYGIYGGAVETTGLLGKFISTGNVSGDFNVGEMGQLISNGSVNANLEAVGNVGTIYTPGLLTGTYDVGGVLTQVFAVSGVNAAISASTIGSLTVVRGDLAGGIALDQHAGGINVIRGDLTASITAGGVISSIYVPNGTFRGTVDTQRLTILNVSATGTNGDQRARITAHYNIANIYVWRNLHGADIGVGLSGIEDGEVAIIGFLFVGGDVQRTNILAGVCNENGPDAGPFNPFSDGGEDGTPYVLDTKGYAYIANVRIFGKVGTGEGMHGQWAIASRDPGAWIIRNAAEDYIIDTDVK